MTDDRDNLRNVRCRGCGEDFSEMEIDRGYCKSCAEVQERINKHKKEKKNEKVNRRN